MRETAIAELTGKKNGHSTCVIVESTNPMHVGMTWMVSGEPAAPVFACRYNPEDQFVHPVALETQ